MHVMCLAGAGGCGCGAGGLSSMNGRVRGRLTAPGLVSMVLVRVKFLDQSALLLSSLQLRLMTWRLEVKKLRALSAIFSDVRGSTVY